MQKTTLENLQVMIGEMMKEEGVQDFEIDLGGNSNVGDGYMGEMIFFKVICKPSGKIHHLLMKAAGGNEKFREVTLLKENFDRETFMYSTVFPEIKAYFRDKNLNVLDNIPKLYQFSNELYGEALIFENLKEHGYTMWNNRGGIVDFEHAVLVLKNLAKWHGCVIAYRDQNPEHFQDWIPQLYDIRYKVATQLGLVKHAHIIFEEILRLLKERNQDNLVMKYSKYKGKLDQFFQPATKNDRQVIAHSDCWINNIMFKKAQNDEVSSECKLLDFQASSFNSPVDDLSIFIYTSCDQDVLVRIDDLLQEYYATLYNTVENLGSNLNEIFTYVQLEQHWKKYGMWGVITAIEIIKLQNFTEDEVPNFRKICEDGNSEIGDYFLVPIKNKDVYFNRLMTVFSHYGNKYL